MEAKVTPDEVVFAGPEVEYAHFLNYGTKNMPARRLTDIKPNEERQMAKIIEGHITKGGRR